MVVEGCEEMGSEGYTKELEEVTDQQLVCTPLGVSF